VRAISLRGQIKCLEWSSTQRNHGGCRCCDLRRRPSGARPRSARNRCALQRSEAIFEHDHTARILKYLLIHTRLLLLSYMCTVACCRICSIYVCIYTSNTLTLYLSLFLFLSRARSLSRARAPSLSCARSLPHTRAQTHAYKWLVAVDPPYNVCMRK